MGGCADKERFSFQGLYHPNQHLPTPFCHYKVKNDNRQIILKPINYLNSTNKIKIDGSLTRVSTKSQLQGTEGHEKRSQDHNRETHKLDKQDFFLKETQSHYVEEQNYQADYLKIDRQCYLLEESIILDKKYDKSQAYLKLVKIQKNINNQNQKTRTKRAGARTCEF